MEKHAHSERAEVFGDIVTVLVDGARHPAVARALERSAFTLERRALLRHAGCWQQSTDKTGVSAQALKLW